MTTITRGDLKPDLEIIIGDDAAQADFSAVTAGMCTVTGELDGAVVFSGPPASVSPSPDGKELTLVRPWVAGDTDSTGRMWITVQVLWPDGDPQTFPEDSALLLQIRRAPGDA